MQNALLRCLTIALLLHGSLATAQATSVTAQRITADHAAQLVKGGPDAIGGIGDWHLSNGTLCAIVSDITHEHEFSASGGALVDLGFCGRADDHYSFSADLINGDRRRPLDGQTIDIDNTTDSASIIVRSVAAGVELQTRYTLDSHDQTQLKIRKRLRLIDDEIADFNLLSIGSFNYHSLETFVFAAQDITRSIGFKNQDFVTRGISAIGVAAHDADTIITLSPPEAEAPISYGWQLQSASRIEAGERKPIPRFILADEESMTFMALVDDFWLGDGRRIGWLQLPQIPLLSLAPGSSLEFEMVIYVGKGASVAAITDQMLAPYAPIKITTTEAHTALHLELADGTPVSHLRAATAGQYALQAPPGRYRLRHRGSAGREVVHADVEHAAVTDLGKLSLPSPATLNLPQGAAMRLVFKGINGTATPDFGDRLTDFTVADDNGETGQKPLAQIFLAGNATDPKYVHLAPGEYQVFATRGLEYSLESTTVKVTAERPSELQISTPKRVVATPGYIAADLHVHAGDSFDNTTSNQERVRTFVAEHGEVMVNSEHDVVVNFAPLVEQMGLADKVATITGVEMTSLLKSAQKPHTGGHVNFFPYVAKPLEYRNGMVAHESKRLREVLHEVRQRNPGSVAQLNHARHNLDLSNATPENYAELIDDGAYLEHMGVAAHPYNPQQPLHSHPNNTLIEPHPKTGVRDLDVDAFEIINPSDTDNQARIAALRRDWLSFLLQGERITGTANSDSHRGSEQVAVPRNMVAVSDDGITTFSRTEFLSSLKRGNSYGTTGPLLELNLEGTRMGETFAGSNASLQLQILSAPWVDVQRLEVQINGNTIKTLDATEQRRFKIPLEFTADAFVTVEVFGNPGAGYAALYPRLTPYAFSNPIYVDADQDGVWQAPGLTTTIE